MHSVKRDLAIGGAIGIMVLALAMAWGSPFVTTNSAHAQDQAPSQTQEPAQPQPDQAKSATFTGTISSSKCPAECAAPARRWLS